MVNMEAAHLVFVPSDRCYRPEDDYHSKDDNIWKAWYSDDDEAEEEGAKEETEDVGDRGRRPGAISIAMVRRRTAMGRRQGRTTMPLHRGCASIHTVLTFPP